MLVPFSIVFTQEPLDLTDEHYMMESSHPLFIALFSANQSDVLLDLLTGVKTRRTQATKKM